MVIKVNGEPNNTIKLLYGEKKKLTYVYSIDVSNAIFNLQIKRAKDGYVIKNIPDGQLDKSEIDDYKVTYLFDTTDFDKNKTYILTITSDFPNGTKDISDRIYVSIKGE